MAEVRKEVLQLAFVDYDGGTKSLRIPDPKEDLTPEEILAVMNTVTTQNVFTSSGGNFVTPKTAKIVETITEEYDITVNE